MEGMNSLSETVAIILAAGKSTRMKSERPKVLHEICGRPMLGYVLSACRLAGITRLVVVVGYGKDEVKAAFEADEDITWVEQTDQKGTGHAVQCCESALRGFKGGAIVIAGDMPLIRRASLASLLEVRKRSGAALTLATTMLSDPSGYGRILRDADGGLEAIVEDRNCTEEQRALHEVNPSYYCFDAELMFDALARIECDASKGEYYLTDAVSVLRSMDKAVTAEVRVPAEDATGINSRLDLATVGRIMQDRIQLALMHDGVTIVDPDNIWIEADVAVGSESTIYPFTFIGAGASIGERCRIGPFARVGPGEVLDDGSVLGPMACQGADTA